MSLYTTNTNFIFLQAFPVCASDSSLRERFEAESSSTILCLGLSQSLNADFPRPTFLGGSSSFVVVIFHPLISIIQATCCQRCDSCSIPSNLELVGPLHCLCEVICRAPAQIKPRNRIVCFCLHLNPTSCYKCLRRIPGRVVFRVLCLTKGQPVFCPGLFILYIRS